MSTRKTTKNINTIGRPDNTSDNHPVDSDTRDSTSTHHTRINSKNKKSDNIKSKKKKTIKKAAAQISSQEPNWYAKLHPIGTIEIAKPKPKRRSKRRKMLNLSLFFRIWIAVAIIIIISGVVIFKQLFNYVRPTTQQVIEDTLVDTAKLLSASLQSAVETKALYKPSYQAKLDAAFVAPDLSQPAPTSKSYSNRNQLDTLSTWYTHKTHSSFRVYVTDANGIVIYDSLSENSANIADNKLINDNIVNDTFISADMVMDETINQKVATSHATGFDNNVKDSNGLSKNNNDGKAQLENDTSVKPDETDDDTSVFGNNIISTNIFSDSVVESLSDTQVYGYTNAEGQDYSRWRDVYLTLRGKYGARTSRKDPNDPSSSVMYVAQPIYSSSTAQKRIIGVVSVGKPTANILPYLNATRQRMFTTSIFIGVICLIMAGLIAWWLKQSMNLVTHYTKSLAQDTQKPYFYLGRELNELTATIEAMKHRLENRAYVTDYVHTLTHELKSPLTAIRASGELLEASDLDEEDRLMLSQTITDQSIKLQSLIDRLLLLAKIEQPTFKLTITAINADALLQQIIRQSEIQCQQHNVEVIYNCQLPNPEDYQFYADIFWVTQALQNVLDNALYFADSTVLVTVINVMINKVEYVEICIFNDGELIPTYAVNKVFDRYFSLSRQVPPTSKQASRNKKGTGLGLTLVKQVVERHGGTINIVNISSGTYATTPSTMAPKMAITPIMQSQDEQPTTPQQGVKATIRFPTRAQIN